MQARGEVELKIEHVQKTFFIDNNQIEVLKDIDLSVLNGQFVSIIGASGCGKSTLLKLIGGLEEITGGSIAIGDRVVTKPKVECGMVFQEPRLFPWLNVERNIEFGIAKKMSRNERKAMVAEHVRFVGLAGFEKAYPGQLSGGMQQRVSIARTLINRPEILLLDEPFGALDALTRIQMQNEILRIWEDHRTTMLLVTHDIDEAIFLSDYIVIMSNRPAMIKKIITMQSSRPRDRGSGEFSDVRREIYQHFFENSDIEIEYYL
jgi:sulfonate transport system ATP-binding protein